MSAELVDPFATPHEPRIRDRGSAVDLHADINVHLALSYVNDPPLCAELVQKALRELACVADGEPQDGLARWAQWLMEELHRRAVGGIPYGEPQEPDWSLDPERRLPR